jgi:hypothetical protein
VQTLIPNSRLENVFPTYFGIEISYQNFHDTSGIYQIPCGNLPQCKTDNSHRVAKQAIFVRGRL